MSLGALNLMSLLHLNQYMGKLILKFQLERDKSNTFPKEVSSICVKSIPFDPIHFCALSCPQDCNLYIEYLNVYVFRITCCSRTTILFMNGSKQLKMVTHPLIQQELKYQKQIQTKQNETQRIQSFFQSMFN